MLWTLKKGAFRVQQKVMKVASQVLPFPIPVLLTGPGSVKKPTLSWFRGFPLRRSPAGKPHRTEAEIPLFRSRSLIRAPQASRRRPD